MSVVAAPTQTDVAAQTDLAAQTDAAAQPSPAVSEGDPAVVASPPRGNTLPLGQQLVEAKLITENELDAALKCQSRKGGRLGELLIELGFLTEEELLPFLHGKLGLPAVQLRDGVVDPHVVRLIPRETAERLNVLAMFKVHDTLSVAMAEPRSLPQIDEIERITRLTVRPIFASLSSIQRMISRCYEEDFEVDMATADFDETSIEIRADVTEPDASVIEELIEGSPIINLVNYLVLQALRQGASDIHIEPSPKHSIVRFRIDGQLREVLRPRRDVHPAIVSRIKVMGMMDIAEQRLPQDGRCQVVAEGREVDLRISTLPTVLGEKAVLRILDRSRLTFDLAVLGFPADLLAQVKQLLNKPYGLLLVSGPTGSGKTTTLYSALELIKSVHRNIVTVEDPVEYRVDLVNQIQVNEAKGLNFPTALRSVLRQDPDVIMVGEIRDAETAQVAVQAALTGHLVLSTIHTNDSAGAVVRLVDMDVESYKVAAALVGVISQRLVRTICPKCQTSYYPPTGMLETLHYRGDQHRSFVRGEGCRDCFDTGFKGRVGVYEVFAANEEVRSLITQQASTDVLRQWHRSHGKGTLLEAALRLAENHVTSLDEVMRVAFFE